MLRQRIRSAIDEDWRDADNVRGPDSGGLSVPGQRRRLSRLMIARAGTRTASGVTNARISHSGCRWENRNAVAERAHVRPRLQGYWKGRRCYLTLHTRTLAPCQLRGDRGCGREDP